ncbi:MULTISPECIES: DUF418 domain-containing protein [Gammaproteobacteria]|uniref:DUF418 domain-containing protein n=1 Tax=Gammaproteobacteria TaxID=1236 RepID=UPI000DCF807C|nr:MULTISPECIES: DUF418 domain-containing protein [Gammaproteobacteria]RTE85803.1 DUF418 domain-containing protein [Aliidiomarina sp. B3213]TCZ90195.1 DUF418 domain-containing protein [Lysobacter sp. N42]
MTALGQPVPTSAQERIQLLDVIRGFALFGILMMNIEFFQRPPVSMPLGFDMSQVGADFEVARWVYGFIQGKFYTMFSLLFGIGFVIFLDRAAAKTEHPKRLFFRRIFFLGIFGAIHAFLIWSGDILLIYAFVGLFLLLFTKKEPEQLRSWAIGLLSFAPALMLAFGAIASLAMATSDGAKMMEGNAEFLAHITAIAAQGSEVYSSGRWVEAVQYRMVEMSTLYLGAGLIFMVPPILGMFLLGSYLFKSGLFTGAPEKSFRSFKKMMIRGYVIGIPLATFLAIGGLEMDLVMPNFKSSLIFFVQAGSNIALCLAYVGTLGWLWHSGKKWVGLFAPAGRMALSNYLAQSVIFTFLFYGYGFGLYGQLGRAEATLIAIAVYILQLFVSRWWMSTHQYGPMEWIWRTLTYGGVRASKNKV